jgi:hypothetical protein
MQTMAELRHKLGAPGLQQKVARTGEAVIQCVIDRQGPKQLGGKARSKAEGTIGIQLRQHHA